MHHITTVCRLPSWHNYDLDIGTWGFIIQFANSKIVQKRNIVDVHLNIWYCSCRCITFDKYVVVPVDKAPDKIVVECKS